MPALLALSACSASTARSTPPGSSLAEPPTPARSDPSAAPAPAVWRLLPDPAQPVPGASLERPTTPVLDVGGIAAMPLDLGALAPGTTHLVLRLVCAGPGAVFVLDGDGQPLYGGDCWPTVAGASADSWGDLTGLRDRHLSGLHVSAGPTTAWRLYAGVA